MTNFTDKSYRKKLFLHLDGIALLPVFNFLLNKKIIHYLKENDATLDQITEKFKTNKGYTNICLRTLWSAGLLTCNNDKKIFSFRNARKSFQAEAIISFKRELNDFINILTYYKDFNNIINMKNPSVYYNNLITCNTHLDSIKMEIGGRGPNLKNLAICEYFEGLLIGPIIAHLGFLNIISARGIHFERLNALEKIITNIFREHKYIDYLNNFTEKGNFFFKRSASYGVTVSYIKTFVRLEDLLINNNYFIWERDVNGNEFHVNRAMNVWGSGGAHKFYFKKIDEIIINIFNKKIEHQPKGIIDIGCGDGTFLEHVYDLAINHSIRKNHIKEYPLKLIGVDINKAARDASRERLEKRNIDHLIIKGNISDPDSINRKLMKKFKLNLKDLLNSRTFLDHNRIYSDPKTENKLLKQSTGGFCFKGNYISSDQLGNNLIEHLSLWKPYINKHGIIILELHTIHPDDSNKYRGKNLSCAYDTTHGFSDQYLVEYDFYIYCCKKAGLKLKDNFLFPNEKIPTVSVGYFK